MIGQYYLQEKVNDWVNIMSVPKSILIAGDKGMGKHLFVKEFTSKYKGMEIVNIEESISPEEILEIYALSIPRFYIIDLDQIGEHKRIERFQNTILKFVEEPPNWAWIIIITSDLNIVLNTIINRCQVLKLAPYTISSLRQIAEMNGKQFDDITLEILRTPGKVIDTELSQIQEIMLLANKMFESIAKSTPANVLSIRNKFFREIDPLDIDLFIPAFLNVLANNVHKVVDDKMLTEFYMATLNLYGKLRTMNINKQHAIDNYLIKLKRITDKAR